VKDNKQLIADLKKAYDNVIKHHGHSEYTTDDILYEIKETIKEIDNPDSKFSEVDLVSMAHHLSGLYLEKSGVEFKD
jgi:hypothetical protein